MVNKKKKQIKNIKQNRINNIIKVILKLKYIIYLDIKVFKEIIIYKWRPKLKQQ